MSPTFWEAVNLGVNLWIDRTAQRIAYAVFTLRSALRLP